MPILPVGDAPTDPVYIKAAMFYPRDRDARDRYIQVALAEYQLSELTDSDTMQIPAGLLRKVLAGENPAARPILSERTKRGIVAGNLGLSDVARSILKALIVSLAGRHHHVRL